MPNSNVPRSEFLTPFVAFPSLLIDRVMPTLKDTEWRLLCVIVRQTIGWNAHGHRHKRRDWMTQRQLMARTGRNSAALSNALNTLVRRRLVDATDEEGNLLLTPQERRRYNGRMYLELCQAGIEALMSLTIDAESKELTAKSAVANANATIEEDHNKLPGGKTSAASSNPGTWQLESRRFLRSYQNLFRERTVSGEAPPLVWGRDMKIARDLLKNYSFERLSDLLAQFFTSDDKWFAKCGYSLPCFKNAIPKLPLRERRRVVTGQPAPHETQPRTYTGWQRAADITNGSRSEE